MHACRLCKVYTFTTVLFLQTNNLCSGMLYDMVKDLNDISKYNKAQEI